MQKVNTDRTISILASIFILTGCATVTATYTPPPALTSEESKYEIIIDKSFDATWSSLIEYASGTFFAIDNFEKASGLITLSFGATDPDRFINCGHMSAQNVNQSFNGPYATYLTTYLGANLSGKMNLVVRQIEPNKTLVKSNARYVFSATSPGGRANNRWVFESGGNATVAVTNVTPGTSPTRTCRPTYAAEKAVLEAVRK